MSFAAVVDKAWRENILFSVLVELTYKCNLNCFYCYNDLELAGKPLSLEQYFDLFADLADMQVFNLVLSGGEPLAHPDFFALGAKARQLGFVVRLKSNGHALHGALAQRLQEEVDPFLVEVSLHGAKAETHDRQTRVAGSHQKLIGNLRQMRQLGMRVKINCTLTRWNEDEIEGMLDLAVDLGYPVHIDPVVTPRDDGDTTPLSIAPSRQGVERLLAVQQQIGQRAAAAAAEPSGQRPSPAATGPQITVGRQGDEMMPANVAGQKKHCGAGSGGVAIDPYGNVFPCVQWRHAVGNLHQQSITEIWRSSGQLDHIRRLNEQVKETLGSHGAWGQGLNFCPGSAVQETGSPFGIYDSARRRADVAQQLAEESKAAASTPSKKPLLPILP